ncbi:MAG: hypothetical protein HC915_08455 [Anaerolineae bacterium]|nr:hypothetical protein [Anaerolineae bacterium]
MENQSLRECKTSNKQKYIGMNMLVHFLLLLGVTVVEPSSTSLAQTNSEVIIQNLERPHLVLWSPNNNNVAVSEFTSGRFVIHVLDLNIRDFVKSFEVSEYEPAIAWSPDGQFLAYTETYETIKIVSIATGQIQTTFSALGATSMSWMPNANVLAVTATEGIDNRFVTTWDTQTGDWLSTYQDNFQGAVSTAWSPDATQLAAVNLDASLTLWETQNNDGFVMLSAGGFYNVPPDFHTNQAIAWSPDGSRIATIANDNAQASYVIYVWDVQNKELLTELIGHDNLVTAAVWSPDGAHIATSSYDSTIRIWDSATFEVVDEFTDHTDFVTSLSWKPDGMGIVSASYDGTIRYWQLES